MADATNLLTLNNLTSNLEQDKCKVGAVHILMPYQHVILSVLEKKLVRKG